MVQDVLNYFDRQARHFAELAGVKGLFDTATWCEPS